MVLHDTLYIVNHFRKYLFFKSKHLSAHIVDKSIRIDNNNTQNLYYIFINNINTKLLQKNECYILNPPPPGVETL
jgi:hypothetical protein